MSQFKQYRKKGLAEMRPYIIGENMTGKTVSKGDTLEQGGMVARNPSNHDDQWYVAKEYFEKNFELIEYPKTRP